MILGQKEILLTRSEAEVIKKLHFIKITNSQASENVLKKGGISENGRVKNLLKENTDRNCQNQLVFRTLKINQRFATIQGAFSTIRPK